MSIFLYTFPESTNTYVVYGPPGTGKTTYLASKVREAASLRGPESVLVVSLTKAAALEIAGRKLPVRRECLGTLHSHAYRALGAPEIAEVHAREWSASRPLLSIRASGRGALDEASSWGDEAGNGEDALLNYTRLRALQRPRSTWAGSDLAFAKAWEDWKRETGYLDFQDLIEIASRDCAQAPGKPQLIYADECFPAGTLILCRRGLIPIESIRAGDEVLTHRARWRRVTRTGSRLAETVVVRGHGHPGIRVTADHPFFIEGGEWCAAHALVGKRWATPRVFPQDAAIPPVIARERGSFGKDPRGAAEREVDSGSDAFAWLIGRYLADGSLSSSDGAGGAINRTWWSIGAPKAARFRVMIEEAGLRWGESPAGANCVNFVVNSSPLARWFEEHCGRGAATKIFPRWALGLRASIREALLEGYMAGDGCDVAGLRKATTASWNLAIGFKLTFQSFGYAVRLYEWERDGSRWFQLVAKKGSTQTAESDLHVFSMAKSAEPRAIVEPVHNIAVEDDESYVADGLVVHNCQDFSRSETALLLKWGSAKGCDGLVVVADPDQAIFEFRGADPQIIRKLQVPPERRKVLEQSWRVPRKVHALALRWISQIKDRDQIIYKPREEDGSVSLHPTFTPGESGENSANWKTPKKIADEIGRVLAREERSTVMVIASCSFMLSPLAAVLKEYGIPFHNPYCPKRGDWNPMRRNAERVASYLRTDPETWGADSRLWTWEELDHWLDVIATKSARLTSGAKAEVERMARDERFKRMVVEPADACALFDLDDQGELPAENTAPFRRDAQNFLFAHGITRDADGSTDLNPLGGDPKQALAWLNRNVLDSKRKLIEYASAVARSRGGRALLERPRVILSTIHGCKGGEADHVFVCADLSPRGAREWGRFNRDQTIRLFYVAFTRARQSLTVLAPVNDRCAVKGY